MGEWRSVSEAEQQPATNIVEASAQRSVELGVLHAAFNSKLLETGDEFKKMDPVEVKRVVREMIEQDRVLLEELQKFAAERYRSSTAMDEVMRVFNKVFRGMLSKTIEVVPKENSMPAFTVGQGGFGVRAGVKTKEITHPYYLYQLQQKKDVAIANMMKVRPLKVWASRLEKFFSIVQLKQGNANDWTSIHIDGVSKENAIVVNSIEKVYGVTSDNVYPYSSLVIYCERERNAKDFFKLKFVYTPEPMEYRRRYPEETVILPFFMAENPLDASIYCQFRKQLNRIVEMVREHESPDLDRARKLFDGLNTEFGVFLLADAA